MEDILPFEDSQKIIFSQKKISIPTDLRPMYKISLIIMMLKVNGHSKRLSYLQIQYLNWLVKHIEQVEDLNLKNDELPFEIIRPDPFLDIAMEYYNLPLSIRIACNSLIHKCSVLLLITVVAV